MGDEEKRDARRFEPPPWEKEAFEALARKKAEEQEALELLAAAQAAAGTPAVAPVAASQPPVEPEAPAEAVEPEREPTAATPGAAEGEAPAAPAGAPAATVDDRQVRAMLLELGREETTPTSHVKLISRIASIVTGIAGTGVVVGGISALQTAGTTPVGVMGSSALSLFGLCFVGMAVWVWVRSNRVRGSL